MSRPKTCERCREHVLPRGDEVSQDGSRFYHRACWDICRQEKPELFRPWDEVQAQLDERKVQRG